MIARGFPAPTFGAASRKPRWGFDVAGDLPDVGRYLSGHPDAMRRRKNERGRDPVAVLYIGCGMRANVSRTDQLNFGIAVCEMIDALENAGTRVELNQLTRAFCGGYYAVTGWRIEGSHGPAGPWPGCLLVHGRGRAPPHSIRDAPALGQCRHWRKRRHQPERFSRRASRRNRHGRREHGRRQMPEPCRSPRLPTGPPQPSRWPRNDNGRNDRAPYRMTGHRMARSASAPRGRLAIVA
jgi:hypothetical protein